MDSGTAAEVTSIKVTVLTLSFRTNSVDAGQMLQNVASNQGLHCLSLIQ